MMISIVKAMKKNPKTTETLTLLTAFCHNLYLVLPLFTSSPSAPAQTDPHQCSPGHTPDALLPFAHTPTHNNIV